MALADDVPALIAELNRRMARIRFLEEQISAAGRRLQLEGMARPTHDHLSRHSHVAVAVARRALEFALEAGLQ